MFHQEASVETVKMNKKIAVLTIPRRMLPKYKTYDVNFSPLTN